MTIDRLIELLEEMREQMPNEGQTKVTLTQQENWPLEYEIEGVADCSEIDDENESGFGDKVTLIEGRQIGYGAKTVFENHIS